MPWRLLLFCWAALAYAQPQNQRYSLRGQVVDRFTGAPLAGVAVTIEGVGFSKAAQPVLSDADGQFTFEGLEAGEYVLGAILNHVPVRDGELRIENKMIEWHSYLVGPGVPEGRVVLRLAAPVILKGTVRDEYGDPMSGNVAVLRQIWRGGALDWERKFAFSTDELGRYRESGLPPGNYRVCAVAEGEAPPLVTLDLKAGGSGRY